MFPMAGIEFLRELAANNDRAWFEDHRSRFEESVRAPLARVVAALERRIEAFAPDYACGALARIHRDVRFAADKSPFKTQMTAVFARAEHPRGTSAAFYVRIDGAGAEVQGGLPMPGAAQLLRLREAIAEDLPHLRAVIDELRPLMGEPQGELLRRVPKGWRADHPAADLLRHRQLAFAARLPLDVVTSERLVHEVALRFEALAPLVTWIDGELGAQSIAA